MKKILTLIVLLFSLVSCQKSEMDSIREVVKKKSSVVVIWNNSIIEGETVVNYGTGFCVGKGLFLTAQHVVANSSFSFVETTDLVLHKSVVVFEDIENDVALLKVTEIIDSKPLEFALNSEVGEKVIIMGHPGLLRHTTSFGRITRKYILNEKQLIQTDASNDRGGSGSPIFNYDGKIVGLSHSMKTQTCNFGLSLEYLKEVLANYNNQKNQTKPLTIKFDAVYL